MSFHAMPRYMMRKNALKRILTRLQKEYGKKDLTILEIGYGAGDIFNLYAELGIKAHGYDFSEKAYQTALQQPAVKSGNVVLYTNWEEIPVEKFDFVIACEVLEHIEDDQCELLKWRKYLKSDRNAGMIISVPAHPERWDNNDIISGHFRRYERTGLYSLFKNCKMHIVCLYTYGFPSSLVLDPLRDRRVTPAASQNISKEVRTKNSGVERDPSVFIRFLSHRAFWLPIIKFQQLFYKTDLGSAYVLLAKRDEEK